MEWTTEKPTERGFYFTTDGSPVLNVEIRTRDGEVIEIAHTWWSEWAGREGIPEDSMSDEVVILPVTEPKYWCKIPVPDKPGSPTDTTRADLEDDIAEDALLIESGTLLRFLGRSLHEKPSDDWEAELDNL